MNSSSLIILFVALAVLSLVVVSFVNHQQTRRRVIASRIHNHRRRILELEEIASAVEPLLENLSTIRYLYCEIQDICAVIQRLDSNINYIEPIMQNAKEMAENFRNSSRNLPLNRALSSDAAIARHKRFLEDLGHVVRKQSGQGRCSTEEAERHVLDITWAILMVDVISHIGQGHIAMDQGQIIKAQNYYKRAQQFLSSSNSHDPRRDEMIREISDLLANNRRSLSVSLMPETHLNPKNDPHRKPENNASGDDLNDLLLGP